MEGIETSEVEPTSTSADTTLSVTDTQRNAVVYIDSNKNKTRDNGEDVCDVCIAKVFNVAQANLYGALPGLSSVKEITINGGGQFDISKVVGTNQAWGFFQDREVLIPNALVLANDGASDLEIPAWETSVTISGVNANITSSLNTGKTENGFEVIYIFDSLLPALKKKADANEEIWIVLTPDLTQPAKLYVASANFTQDKNKQYSTSSTGYYLKVNWSILEEFDTAVDADNVNFVLL